MKNYQKLYSTYEEGKLFEILREEDKYEVDALEAAKLELQKRGVSLKEIVDFQHRAIEERDRIRDEIKAQKENSITEDHLFETIDVVPEVVISEGSNKKRKALLYFLVLIMLYSFYINYSMYLDILINGFKGYSFVQLLFIVLDFVFVYGLYLFWHKNKKGWILLSFIHIFNLITLSFTIIMLNFYYSNTISIFSNFRYFGSLIISLGVTWLLSNADIKNIFGVEKIEFTTTITISIIVGISYLIFFAIFINRF